MRVGQAFPSKYIKAADLSGRKVAVTIDSVEMANIGDDQDKLVVYFKDKSKGLVLNVTNANMIAEIAGTDETDDWRGTQIALYPTKVDFQGRRVEAIRVDYPTSANNRQPAPRQPEPPPVDNDDIPF